MTFSRLTAADGLAMVVALALLFAMAADWYSTHAGDEARRIERSTEPEGGAGGQISRGVDERAKIVADGAEKNAWQLRDPVDRGILGALLATVLVAISAGFTRAAGKRFEPPWTPSALAALLAAISGLLVGIRMLFPPGLDDATTVKPGAAIALSLLGLLVVFCARAVKAEEAGTVWREPAPEAGREPGAEGGSIESAP